MKTENQMFSDVLGSIESERLVNLFKINILISDISLVRLSRLFFSVSNFVEK